MPDLMTPAGWLPLAFLILMGLSLLAYVILDGYDLGVGILLRRASDEQKDTMISSIGPFWDANETWLVLGIGILLVAFPVAHGVILGAVYLPVTLMLIGLILRGVAFDFRVKARAHHKPWWNIAFYTGSALTTFTQGYMLGQLITGFQSSWVLNIFSLLVGLCLMAGYSLLGSGWLIIKTTGELQLRAVTWARGSLWLTILGIGLISIVTPLVSESIFDKWFTLQYFPLLLPIPIITIVLFFIIERSLKRLPNRLKDKNEYGAWVPFGATIGVFILAFYGLAYSLFPYLVIDQITIWDAASAPESLMIIFVGAMVVIPMIIAYSIFAYWVFWGKATDLSYS